MSEVVITVRGEHEARVAPEEGVVHLSVRAEGPERGAVVERIASLADPAAQRPRRAQGAGRRRANGRASVSRCGRTARGTPRASSSRSCTTPRSSSPPPSPTSPRCRGGSPTSPSATACRSTASRGGSPARPRSATEADVAAAAVHVAVDRATAVRRRDRTRVGHTARDRRPRAADSRRVARRRPSRRMMLRRRSPHGCRRWRAASSCSPRTSWSRPPSKRGSAPADRPLAALSERSERTPNLIGHSRLFVHRHHALLIHNGNRDSIDEELHDRVSLTTGWKWRGMPRTTDLVHPTLLP